MQFYFLKILFFRDLSNLGLPCGLKNDSGYFAILNTVLAVDLGLILW